MLTAMFQKIPFPNKPHQRQAFFFFYIVVIAIISLFPADSSALPVKHIDKVGHFIAYVAMAILALVSFKGWHQKAFAVLLTVIVAILLEWGQGFVPGRLSNFADGITNILGLLTGMLIYWKYDGRFQSQQNENITKPRQ